MKRFLVVIPMFLLIIGLSSFTSTTNTYTDSVDGNEWLIISEGGIIQIIDDGDDGCVQYLQIVHSRDGSMSWSSNFAGDC